MTTIGKVKMVTNTQAGLGQLLRLEKAFLDSIAPGAPVVKGPGHSDQPKPNVSGVKLPEPARTAAAAAVATAKRESERKERKCARKFCWQKKETTEGGQPQIILPRGKLLYTKKNRKGPFSVLAS